jgi:methionine-rich copper-binding protein CopC
VCLFAHGDALAHDAHVETDPPSGSQLDEPITEIVFEFDEPIGDDTEIAVFDPNEEQLDSETTRVSETAAKVTFDEIDVAGDYIARYLTSSIEDGHLLVGAITFSYGSPASGPSTLQWALLCLGAVLILSTGAFFSYRRYRQLSAGEPSDSDVDEDLADVGV